MPHCKKEYQHIQKCLIFVSAITPEYRFVKGRYQGSNAFLEDTPPDLLKTSYLKKIFAFFFSDRMFKRVITILSSI